MVFARRHRDHGDTKQVPTPVFSVPLCAQFVFFLLLFFPFLNFSQVPETETTEQNIEKLAETIGEDADYNTLTEYLEELAANPVDINSKDVSLLLDASLLTELQFDALKNHIAKNGNLLALEELQTIDGFDLVTINTIRPYITLKASLFYSFKSVTQMLKQAKNQVTFRYTRVLEEQRGFIRDTLDPDYPSSGYLGDENRYYFRYRIQYLNRLSAGVTAEKDAGEEFFEGHQKNGFDFYSAHAFVRGNGFVRAIAIGDYQLEYGQGLTLWSGLAFGKSSDAPGIKRIGSGIRPYTSVNEYLFRRGGAVALGIKNWQLDLFYSSKNIDANITDTLDNGEALISSFQESGYHRTENEIADDDAIYENFFGGHLSFKKRNFSFGITATQLDLDASLLPSPQLYNKFYFRGTKLFNAGADYSYLWRNLHFFGETSYSDNGAVATVNGMLISLDPKVIFAALVRSYPRTYHALYANPVSESTSFNERAVYTGISIKPLSNISFSAYSDMFSFPWLRYQVNAPSHGAEYLAQLTYVIRRKAEFYVRYKHTAKEDNRSGEFTPIDELEHYEHRGIRLHASYKVSQAFSFRSRIERVTYNRQYETASNGFMIYHDINCKPMGKPYSFALRYALFETDDYDSRIYAYENDVPGSFSIPAYYYRGNRFYIMLRYRIVKGVDVWLRFVQTYYSNRDVIGSGNDEIKDNTKSEVKAQVRVEF